MFQFVIKRLLYMIPTLIAISIVTFIVINLPPGDYVDRVIARARERGEVVSPEEGNAMRILYNLDESLPAQYVVWISDIVLRGDFGTSFRWNLPVSELVWERLALTFVLAFSSLLFIWAVALLTGVYSAVRKYSTGDYVATFISFIGVAVPDFLIALVLLYVSFRYFGQSIGGLFSPQFIDAPWSSEKVVDLLGHLWIPVIVLAVGGTASLIRTLRANLLDELRRPYVTTARTKGMPEMWLLIKYPLRHALNPFVSALNDNFVGLVSGTTIVSVVLSLQTLGPLLLESLQDQDMYLAGSTILMLSVLTVFVTLLSDLLLGWIDPRIRFR